MYGQSCRCPEIRGITTTSEDHGPEKVFLSPASRVITPLVAEAHRTNRMTDLAVYSCNSYAEGDTVILLKPNGQQLATLTPK